MKELIRRFFTFEKIKIRYKKSATRDQMSNRRSNLRLFLFNCLNPTNHYCNQNSENSDESE